MTKKKGGTKAKGKKRTTKKAPRKTKAQRAAQRAPASQTDLAPVPEPTAPTPEEDQWVPEPPPSREPEPIPESVPPEPEPEPPAAPRPAPVAARPIAAPPPAPPAAPAPKKQWEPAAAKPVAPAPLAEDDQWVRIATVRQGMPGLSVTGWVLTGLGLAIVAGTYYWGFLYGTLYQPAGIRGDYLGAALAAIGLTLGLVFLFTPARRPTGLGLDSKPSDFQRAAKRAHARVRQAQVWAGVSLGLSALGLLWVIYWVRIGHLEQSMRNSVIANYLVPSHYLGAALTIIGVGVALYFWGRVGMARRARNLAVIGLVSALRSGGVPEVPTLPGGVSEGDVQNLMKRLDSLMAQLPDDTVSEFSRTPEADTYLKLLGS